MKSIFFALTMALSCFLEPAYAQKKPLVHHIDAKPVSFDFQVVNVSQVIGLVYKEALKVPYVIDPLVLRDDRLVSFRFDSSSSDFRKFWATFLDSLGFAVEVKNGIDFVSPKKQDVSPSIANEIFVYRPRYRSAPYLLDLLSALFKPGSFSAQRNVKPTSSNEKTPTNAPSGSAAATIDADADVLVFQAAPDEVQKLRRLLAQVDLASGDVLVKAVVYEVSTGKSDGTAFSLALSLLRGKLGLVLGAKDALANSVSLKTASIDAAFSAFSGDSRFKAVSTPHLRVKSGQQARLMVGQDVPTLGAVSYPQSGGAAVQAVEYRSSGVILGLTPTVRESGVDLVIDQQISDFAKTETGVNSSPTLTKRSFSTTVGVSDGELIVLGGLTQDKLTSTNTGLSFLPQFMRTASGTDSRTEVLLLLQVTRIAL